MELYNSAEWLVDRHVNEGRGDRVAFRFEGESISFRQLLDDIERAQQGLIDLGLEPGDRVAMVVNDEPSFVSWFLGAQRGGFVPVPLSTMLSGSELAPIVADSRAVALAVSAAHEDRIAPIAEACPSLRDTLVFGKPALARPAGVEVTDAGSFAAAHPPVADTTVDTPAFWLYSSGTTGVPKGVIHAHASPQATVETYGQQVLEITEEDRFFSIAKLFFAYGLGNSLSLPLAVGATAILDPRPPTPNGVLAAIEAERPSLFFASPGFIAALLDSNPDPSALKSVRATVTAGESLPADLLKRFRNHFGHPILDGIGSTEALHIFISNTLTHQEPGASGVPVPGYELELRDADGDPVEADDTPGFLHVRGPSTTIGYWECEEAAAEVFFDDWLKTGDVYTRSAGGYWTFLGRNSDMIKPGGIWVSPAEVESALIEHPDVLEAAAVGARDDDGLETVVAFVVPASGHAIDGAELQRHCRERMAAFKRPRRIIEVPELPKTATGKIKRFNLRAQLADGA